MQRVQKIFVTGGTGKQGGAVARNLIQNGFEVLVLTRNPAAAPAQNLANLGAKIIKGDLNNPQSWRDQLQNVDGLFSVQAFEYGAATEIKQGKTLIDLARDYNIRHFLYSSVVGADLPTGIPHWESKFQIENYLRQANLSFTIIRPASLYENFLMPQVRNRILKGKLVSPLDKNKVQQYIGADDIGKCSVNIFSNPEIFRSRTINLAAEELDSVQIATIFSLVLGRPVKCQKLPMLITRLVMGKDLYKMFRWVNQNNAIFIDDLAAIKKEFPHLTSLKDWARIHFNTGGDNMHNV